MARRVIVFLLSLSGTALLVLGATWSHWHSPQMLWSREQANEYTDAWRALKAAATSGLRPADPKTDPKLAAAQARFDAISAKLQRARAYNDYTATVLCVFGVALALAGGWFHWSRDRSTPSAARRLTA